MRKRALSAAIAWKHGPNFDLGGCFSNHLIGVERMSSCIWLVRGQMLNFRYMNHHVHKRHGMLHFVAHLAFDNEALKRKTKEEK